MIIRAICFDLMDTVLYDPYREALVAATGVDLKTAARARDHRPASHVETTSSTHRDKTCF